MLEDIEDTELANIGYFYSGLRIKRMNGVCYWGIESYDGDCWKEIPSALFDELMKEKQ